MMNERGKRVAERDVKSLILAAGMSTRLKSRRSKVLHEICGRPILSWVLEACRSAGTKEQIVVVGAMRDQVQHAYADADDITWVVQEPQHGTGHAVMAAEDALADFTGDLVVLMGDAPLVRAETLRMLIRTHRAEQAAVTLMTAVLDDPKCFGRIVRDAGGNLEARPSSRRATRRPNRPPSRRSTRRITASGGRRSARCCRESPTITPRASIT